MPFVKLDCNMLRSTLWYERLQREIFITALLMAEPIYTDKPMPQINTRNLDETGWSVPPSEDRPYGFVPAAGVGIVRCAIATNDPEEMEAGMEALEKLGQPEQSSRTPDFEGRRLVRVNGGYIVLNYGKYREQDYTAAERQKRYRERQKSNAVTSASNGVTLRNSNVTSRKQKQKQKQIKNKEASVKPMPPAFDVEAWLSELEKDETYKGLNVRQEFGKCRQWCSVRGLTLSKRRFVNWINKAEKPLHGNGAAKVTYKRNYLPPAREPTEAEIENARAIAKQETEALRAKLKPA